MAVQHDRSVAQEHRLAKAVGGSRNVMSGAGWSRKNDVRCDDWLIEAKRTDNKRSITIKADDLEELRRNAAKSDRSPALGFELNSRNYVIVTEADWLEWVEARRG